MDQAEKERRKRLNKKTLKKTVKWCGIAFVVFIAGMLISDLSTRPPVAEALAFEAYTAEKWDNEGRASGEIVIFSEAKTYNQRAHTTMKAAMEWLKQEELEYVRSYHLPYGDKILLGKGYVIARADYAPDGGGVTGKGSLKNGFRGAWEASAYRGEMDEIRGKMAVMWETMRGNYQLHDKLGKYTDEPALRQAIYEKLGGKVSLERLLLPIFLLEDYKG